MKVYKLPHTLPVPEIDYAHFDMVKVSEQERDHAERVKAYLIERGYTGKNTGRIFREPFADGYAQYMFADIPRRPALVHLPYGDAWDAPNVRFIPAKEVLRRMGSSEKISALFADRDIADGGIHRVV